MEPLWDSGLVIAGRRDCESKYDDLGQGTSLGIQWLRLYAPNARGLGLITGQGTRSHMLQLRVYMLHLNSPHAITKINNPMCPN